MPNDTVGEPFEQNPELLGLTQELEFYDADGRWQNLRDSSTPEDVSRILVEADRIRAEGGAAPADAFLQGVSFYHESQRISESRTVDKTIAEERPRQTLGDESILPRRKERKRRHGRIGVIKTGAAAIILARAHKRDELPDIP